MVASPAHVTDTQDDVRIDYINQQAGTRLFQCNDGLTRTGPVVANECSRPGSATNQAVLNQRMDDEQTRLKAQFAAMEAAMSQSQTQQAWLTSQISSLP